MKRAGRMLVDVRGKVVLLVALVALIGCAQEGGGGAQDTSAAPGAGGATPAPGPTAEQFTEAAITPQMIALGDSIFEGQAAGGICFTCHGPDAKGGPLGPDLTDQQWLNGDGSLTFIATAVRSGIAQPKQFPSPMPAFGATLDEQRIRAVAAYVYSLSHPGTGD